MGFVLLLIYFMGRERMAIEMGDYFPTMNSCLAYAMRPEMQPTATILARENGWDKAEFGCARKTAQPRG